MSLKNALMRDITVSRNVKNTLTI